MRVIADLHIHSRYSRATSEKMCIEEIGRFARIKGLNLVGSGDFTHPKWLAELRESLAPEADTGLLRVGKNPDSAVYFMITTEVSTAFTFGNEFKKIHHVILTPSIENAVQINDKLSRHGNLASDGRPTLNMDAAHLVEEIMETSNENVVFPAHVWTPWFSIFGAFSGFNSVEECYQDMTKHIHALETGLSCYDEKTEVLTDNGWKKFSEVQYSDKICSLQIETNKIEFQKPLRIFTYAYKGKMYRLKTKRVDLFVTPNHRLLVSKCDFRKPPIFILREARSLFNKSKRIKKDGVWVGENREYFLLPSVKIKHGSRHCSGFRVKSQKRFPLRNWLKFFGFWLAEGWTTNGSDEDYNVCLSNKNQVLLSEMRQILEEFGYAANQTSNRIRVRDFQLYSYLKQFGKSQDKFIPKEIKSLSKQLLETLLEYYLKGNGHIYGRRGRGLSATTSSIHLRDDLQETALKVGISAYYKIGRKKGTSISSANPSFEGYKHRYDSWQVYFLRKNTHAILPSTVKKYGHMEAWVDFDGLVFCVSVPNQVIYVRRNGIPEWCGNSDPPMNWRLSSLDPFTLLSNSDSHSPWPWRIGREANVFELDRLTYHEIADAIRLKDRRRLMFTVETEPAYGKYHWTGHRNCHVSLSAADAIKFGNICPVCRRKLTKGVEQRVEELANRPAGYTPENSIGFKCLLPLSEIIAKVTAADSPSTQKVWTIYNTLIEKFGNELKVLIDATEDSISHIAGKELADAVIKVRERRAKVTPGYDGVYGELILSEDQVRADAVPKRVQQMNLTDFTF